VGSIPASNHGGRARILYLWWYASPGAATDQPGVQDWYIPTEVEPGFPTFGGMLVPVLQLISPVCKTGTSRALQVRVWMHHCQLAQCDVSLARTGLCELQNSMN
jgi:hypothetical protein